MSVLSKELSFLLLIAWLLSVAVPAGGLVGFAIGKLITIILHEAKQRTLIDVLLGITGFAVGTFLSTVGFSVEEEWENGLLVYRKTTGFGDYLFAFALIGAVLAVASRYLLARPIRKLRGKNQQLARVDQETEKNQNSATQ